MAKLKLVVSFLDNGERCPEHRFGDKEIEFLKNFEKFKVYDRLSEKEIAEYVQRGEEDERGIVRLAIDAADYGYDKIDEIMRREDIPNDLALA